ncbi:MAG: hypothetical protein GXP33_15845 [Spirochaetes bacterium]|nr:hypothetical protein [Spirochaetota bacterium]
MKHSEIAGAAEYPFYAAILPFEGRKYRKPVSINEAAITMALAPFYALNLAEGAVVIN